LKRGRKGDLGRRISRLWRHGQSKKVILYNKNDCILTEKIWWKCVNERIVYSGLYKKDGYWTFDHIGITTIDLLRLTGKKPSFSLSTWKQRLRKDGSIIEQKKGPRRSQQAHTSLGTRLRLITTTLDKEAMNRFRSFGVEIVKGLVKQKRQVAG
jgi:hypothetical protein